MSMFIEPRTLKGFRDFLPETMLPREMLIERATSIFRRFGFNPIDTPALEFFEILSGKGSDETDRQLYQFRDQGDRHVGLRFDLTVPFARFAAQHIGQLGTPFKRYHIAKVWRGENPQAGRYREFMQCDFDTIGTKSLACDIETALVINELMENIDLKNNKPFENFTIRINNRLVLTGLLEKLGLSEKSVAILRCLDKLPKIGRDKVIAEMQEKSEIAAEEAAKILDMASLSGSNDSILASLSEMLSGNATGEEGVAKLSDFLKATKAAGVPEGRILLDVSIARGLDYYTGTIFETFLNDKMQIGSVCSGGRYDNLAGLYTKEELPGVGASLGLDRLLAALEDLDMLPSVKTTASIFMPYFAENRLGDYLSIAAKLRKAGFGVEFYPEAKKLGQQLKYADKRGFQYAVIIGESEFENGTAQIKTLATAQSVTVKQDEILAYLS